MNVEFSSQVQGASTVSIAASFFGTGLIDWLVILLLCFCSYLVGTILLREEKVGSFADVCIGLVLAVCVSMTAKIVIFNMGGVEGYYQLVVLVMAIIVSANPKKAYSLLLKKLSSKGGGS